jgi:hypothetical protein
MGKQMLAHSEPITSGLLEILLKWALSWDMPNIVSKILTDAEPVSHRQTLCF